MIPATMPQWSRSCTLIEDAIGVMTQKYHSSPLQPAECRLYWEESPADLSFAQVSRDGARKRRNQDTTQRFRCQSFNLTDPLDLASANLRRQQHRVNDMDHAIVSFHIGSDYSSVIDLHPVRSINLDIGPFHSGSFV